MVLCLASFGTNAQFTVPQTTGWKEAQKNGIANISVLWYDIEPFIYRSGNHKIMGVEYELMEGFSGFLKQKYGIELRIRWVDAGSFENIYPFIKASKEKGLFGLSFYSITNERKAEVKFSPPYMPDLNVLVTNNSLPAYESDAAFINDLPKLRGYTMKQTTMEADLQKLKRDFFPALPISNEVDDYEVLKQISLYRNSFGYVTVSIYVVALQRGIKIKRQRILATRREGFAAIYTKESDWDEPVAAYFTSPECRVQTAGLIRKYLGEEVAGIIEDVSAQDTISGKPSDIELLTKEREIVTRRLIDTALDAERSQTQRNILLLLGGAVLVIALISFSKFRTKARLSKILQQRNNVIAEQKKKMEALNQQLNMKILQSKLNPHFLFNSL
ncbi:MAG TPA: transporter substrate-binding domain-containing protein, partial [Flavisolibacter sp.]|nr:transporter substrate-binding domain-containing protein [Flavisolibacter sp.]